MGVGGGGDKQAFPSRGWREGTLTDGRTHHSSWPACPGRAGHGLFLRLVPHSTGSGATHCGSRLRKLAYESPSDCPAQWWPPLAPGPSWKKAGPGRGGAVCSLASVLRGEGRETEAQRGKRAPHTKRWAGWGWGYRLDGAPPNPTSTRVGSEWRK